MSERVRIGVSDDCDVKIRLQQAGTQPENGVAIEVERQNGTYRIVACDPVLEVKLTGCAIKLNKPISDGDEVWIGPSGPSIHFFPIEATTALVPGRRDGGAHVAPFIEQAAMEASATARRDDAKIFLREFTRELIREINPSTKIILFAIIIFAVVGALYIGFAQFNEARRGRQIITQQQSELTAQQEQLRKANEQLGEVVKSNKQVLNTLSLGEMLRVDYGAGVCLIYGSYTFVQTRTGRAPRISQSQTKQSGKHGENRTEQPGLD